MRAWILIAFVGLACSDPDPLAPKPTDDGCNGCTLEQPVQVTGQVGIDGVVRVANEADGTLKVRIDEAISVRGPVEVTGTVDMQPPNEPIPVAISSSAAMPGLPSSATGFAATAGSRGMAPLWTSTVSSNLA
jgi:hypothetical protein